MVLYGIAIQDHYMACPFFITCPFAAEFFVARVIQSKRVARNSQIHNSLLVDRSRYFEGTRRSQRNIIFRNSDVVSAWTGVSCLIVLANTMPKVNEVKGRVFGRTFIVTMANQGWAAYLYAVCVRVCVYVRTKRKGISKSRRRGEKANLLLMPSGYRDFRVCRLRRERVSIMRGREKESLHTRDGSNTGLRVHRGLR